MGSIMPVKVVERSYGLQGPPAFLSGDGGMISLGPFEPDDSSSSARDVNQNAQTVGLSNDRIIEPFCGKTA